MKTVVLLTAGLGSRMGKYRNIINKTLLPIRGKAIISHIIEQFPAGTKFVVAVGFKSDMVQSYLTLAHPEIKFDFVQVKNFAGPGAGPAQSLKACRDRIEGPFTFITCDGYYQNLNSIPEDKNYVCISKINPDESYAYCNVSVVDGKIQDVVDKHAFNSGLAVSGVFFIRDTDKFWDNLFGCELASGWSACEPYAHEVPWVDLGTVERYERFARQHEAYDNSKLDEFLYIVNGRVIKWFKDVTISKNRMARMHGKEKLFPKIEKRIHNWYSYKLVKGDVLYKSVHDEEVFLKFIEWMNKSVWTKSKSTLTSEDCKKFYYDKTMKRLEMFREKYPSFDPHTINGRKMEVSMEKALVDLDWDRIFTQDLEKRSVFFHGDLQFDNVIFDGSRFTLIDWRQDFAGRVDTGDLYYDIAKLIGGMIINYDYIREGKFWFFDHDNQCALGVARRSEYDHYIEGLFNVFKDSPVSDILPLIFLNMAPLHTQPLDKLLYCLALHLLNGKMSG